MAFEAISKYGILTCSRSIFFGQECDVFRAILMSIKNIYANSSGQQSVTLLSVTAPHQSSNIGLKCRMLIGTKEVEKDGF